MDIIVLHLHENVNFFIAVQNSVIDDALFLMIQ